MNYPEHKYIEFLLNIAETFSQNSENILYNSYIMFYVFCIESSLAYLRRYYYRIHKIFFSICSILVACYKYTAVILKLELYFQSLCLRVERFKCD